MEFTAEQYNFVDPPARYFSMEARKVGMPVDVLHVFEDASATMTVRLLSLLPLVDSEGPQLTRAETVTLLNDLAILAPGALATPGIRWEGVDDRSAVAHYTVGSNTISALLIFNDADELIDFISEDRLATSADGRTLERRRWSTPVSVYRDFGPWNVASHGQGRWHPEDAADFAYIDLELLELEVNPGPK